MSSNLTIENSADTLLYADLHQAAELKEKCLDYITGNASKVMATEGWNRLQGSMRTVALMNELFAKVVAKSGR